MRIKPKNTVDYVVIGPDGFATKGTPKIALGLWKQTKDGLRVVKIMSPTWPRLDGVPEITITTPTGGSVKVADIRPGTVVEVEGAEILVSGVVRHGHIKRLRPDKHAADCTFAAVTNKG